MIESVAVEAVQAVPWASFTEVSGLITTCVYILGLAYVVGKAFE